LIIHSQLFGIFAFMKKMSLRQWTDLVNVWLLCAFAFVLPWSVPRMNVNLTPFILGFLLLNWLVRVLLVDRKIRIKNRTWMWMMIFLLFYYLLNGVGILYSKQPGCGDLFQKLPFVILPLVLFTAESIENKKVKCRICSSFVLGCIVAILLTFVHAVLADVPEGQIVFSKYYYGNLAWLQHPSYLSMMYCFALMLVLKESIHGSSSQWKVAGLILVSIIFVLNIILLASRAGQLTFLLAIFVYFVYELIFGQKKWQTSLLLMAMVLVFGCCYQLIPKSMNRVTRTVVAVEGDANKVKQDGRMQAWKSAYEIGMQNFPLGVGTNDIKDHLQEHYLMMDYQAAIKKHLNAHNQYLQDFAAIGILGLLSLLCCLAYPLIIGVKKRDIVLILFVLILAVNLFFESMLLRQVGIMFAVFFTCVLMMDISDKKFDNENSKHSRGEASVR
jgi:O-antigen ligase